MTTILVTLDDSVVGKVEIEQKEEMKGDDHASDDQLLRLSRRSRHQHRNLSDSQTYMYAQSHRDLHFDAKFYDQLLQKAYTFKRSTPSKDLPLQKTYPFKRLTPSKGLPPQKAYPFKKPNHDSGNAEPQSELAFVRTCLGLDARSDDHVI